MLFFRMTVDEYIIKENHNKFPQIRLEDLAHDGLECRRESGETKWNDHKLVMPHVYGKSGLMHI